ncbi:soluble NSF attachment protein alpha [Pelomyxa schiedti]|nr:soluble NSF attachment protein alpha [Pelomyxa schiedti]
MPSHSIVVKQQKEKPKTQNKTKHKTSRGEMKRTDATDESGETTMVQRAREYYAMATKKLQCWCSGTGRLEDAADLFTKAGNLFKVSKYWNEAGDSFEKSADCYLRAHNRSDAVSDLANAAGCYRKGDSPAESTRVLTAAIELFMELGRFSCAARHKQELAETFESQDDLENAAATYEEAADLFEADDSPSRKASCLAKVATLCSLLERYDRAIELFEKVGTGFLETNLLKWSAKSHFTMAVICQMAKGDTVAARRALEKYTQLDAMFSSSRECKLLTSLIEACENHDVDSFTTATAEYDTITKLTPCQTTLLLRIKKTLESP